MLGISTFDGIFAKLFSFANCCAYLNQLRSSELNEQKLQPDVGFELDSPEKLCQ